MTLNDSAVLGGRYALAAVLGRGGMADVYRAEDQLLERDVAVKVLRDSAADPAGDERFRAEARTLAGLDHPHLVTVLDAGRAEIGPYLVLELVNGASLSAMRGTALDPATVAVMGRDLADALAYVHRRGIVHRDIKPGNVLVDRQGQVHLTDFGIARLLSDATRHTATGATIGTAAYLAPEQVRGDPVSTAADIYALGLVLLESLTGRRTYTGAPMEAALARLHRAPQVPTSLPGAWRDLLAGMTTSDPAQRSTAFEVTHRLAALANGERDLVTVTPRPAPPTEKRSARRRRRAERRGHRSLGVLLAGVVAVLAVAVGALLVTSAGGGADVPDNVPSDLRQPLTALHDAVNG